jgi:hypothetical protein
MLGIISTPWQRANHRVTDAVVRKHQAELALPAMLHVSHHHLLERPVLWQASWKLDSSWLVHTRVLTGLCRGPESVHADGVGSCASAQASIGVGVDCCSQQALQLHRARGLVACYVSS